MSNIILAGNGGGNGGALLTMVLYLVLIAVFFYFFLIRPQKKQQAQQQALLDSMAIGDSVVTTAGFYGVIIDMLDDIVIVEFGNNKNCRIPMRKTAIVEVEKANKGDK